MGSVGPGISDFWRNGVGIEKFGGIWPQHRGDVRERSSDIDPSAFLFFVQYHGRPMMPNGFREPIGNGGEDGKRPEDFASLWVCQLVLDAG